MINGRANLAWPLLAPNGCQYVSIDDVMYSNLFAILSHTFGRANHVATVIWEKVHTRKNAARHFSVSHDYIPCFAAAKRLGTVYCSPGKGLAHMPTLTRTLEARGNLTQSTQTIPMPRTM